MILDLPSGLRGEARKLRGQELITLAERAKSGSDTTLGEILRNCWGTTTDQGPYPFATVGEANIPWNRIYKADLLSGIIQLRVASVPDGDRYEFPIQCEKCQERYDWVINSLMNDLPVQRMSEAARAHLLTGAGRFETETLSGVGITFKLLTVEDDEPLKKLMKLLERKTLTVVEALAVQTTTIAGVSDDPKDLRKRQRWFAELDYDELLDLRRKFDQQDCGIELEIRTTCQNDRCKWPQDTTVPFGRTFFRPEPKKVSTSTSTTPDTSSGQSFQA